MARTKSSGLCNCRAFPGGLKQCSFSMIRKLEALCWFCRTELLEGHRCISCCQRRSRLPDPKQVSFSLAATAYGESETEMCVNFGKVTSSNAKRRSPFPVACVSQLGCFIDGIFLPLLFSELRVENELGWREVNPFHEFAGLRGTMLTVHAAVFPFYREWASV